MSGVSGVNGVTRVDAHHHVWDLGVRDQPWITGQRMAPIRRDFSLADLAPLAREAGIGRTILVQTVPDPAETPEFLALAAGSDLVAGVVGWVDLTGGDVAGALADLPAGPLVGIRHGVQAEPDASWLCRPDVRKGLQAVADAGLVFDLLTLPHQLPAAIETVRALPGLTFVLDHLSKPPIASGELEPWASAVRTLAAEPNTFCKLSGMVTEAPWQDWTAATLRPYAEVVLDAFGPDRVMFGSDWPVCLLAASYAEVVTAAADLTAGLSPGEREAVFGGSAVRAYRL
ncbi:amidohydrolase family protein [Streptosporangium soli]|nr:amidohydrolase family protein [Streptosporangium sp. KLBMP 9127]